MKIKLPLLPKQREFLKSESPEPYYIGGFGSGKTYILVRSHLILAMKNQGCRSILTEPTYTMVDDILTPELEAAIDEFGIEADWNKSAPPRVRLPKFRHTIMLRSREKPNRLKGPTVSHCTNDEIAQDKNETALLILESRVRDPKAVIRQLGNGGTPEGMNWLPKRLEKKGGDAQVIHAATRENYFLPDDYEAKLRASYPDYLIQAYLEGEFVSLTSNQACWMFGQNNIAPVSFNPVQDVYFYLDFNARPYCALVWQKYREECHIIDEIQLSDYSTSEDMAAEFLNRYKELLRKPTSGQRVIVGGDLSGKAHSTRSRESDYSIIITRLANEIGKSRVNAAYHIAGDMANPAHKDSLVCLHALIRRKLANGEFNYRFKVNPKCKRLQDSLKQTTLIEGSWEIDKKPGVEHFCDIARYIAWWEYKIQRYRT